MSAARVSRLLRERRLLGPAAAGILALGAGLGAGIFIAVGLEEPILLIGAIALTVGIAALVWPTLAVGLLVGAIYTLVTDLAADRFGVPSLIIPLAVGTAGLVVFRRILDREPGARVVHNAALPAFLLVLAWFGVVVLGAVYADAPDRTWSRVLELARVLVVFFSVVIAIRKPGTFRAAGWAVIAGGGFMAAVNLFQFVTGSFGNDYLGFAQSEVAQIVTDEADAPRIGGPLASPNFFALVLIPVIVLAWDRVRSEESTGRRLFAAVCGVLAAGTVVFTFSRGALIGIVVVVVILLWRNRPTPKQVAVLALLAAFVFLALPSNYRERASAVTDLLPGSTQTENSDPSIRGRTSEVLAAWHMFLDHPVLGVGSGNYEAQYQEYAAAIGLELRRVERQPHSLPLEIAAEHGLVGLATFGALLWVCMTRLAGASRLMRRLGDHSTASMMDALWLGMVGWLASSVVLQLAYPRLFWMLLALATAAPTVALGTQSALRRSAAGGGRRVASGEPVAM